MTITARYPGECASCGGAITAGDKIEWQRGAKPRHTKCSAGRSRRRPPKPTARREPQPGERSIHRRSRGRDDGYEAGDVVRIGEAYYTVVERGTKYRDDDDDEWYCEAIARPATDEESRELRERREAAAERKARLAELDGLIRSDALTDERLPAGSVSLVDAIGKASGHIWSGMAGHRDYRLAPDGAVWRTESSYDDMPRAWRSTDPRAAEIMRELMGEAS